MQQCGLHGMRKMWSEEDVTMLTLSNGIVTPSVCLSYQRQRNEAVTYTKKKKAKTRKCFHTRCWEAAGEFYFSVQCWSAKRRKYVFTSVMGTEFFTLCLIRKREKRERGVKKTEECSESEAMFVCVCLCPAPVSCSADKQAFKHNFIHYISSGFPIKERVMG